MAKRKKSDLDNFVKMMSLDPKIWFFYRDPEEFGGNIVVDISSEGPDEIVFVAGYEFTPATRVRIPYLLLLENCNDN